MNLPWLSAFLDFVKSWAGALAAFGAGTTAIWLRQTKRIEGDVETFLALIAAFGFWMLVALALQNIRMQITGWREERHAAEERVRAAAQAARSAQASQEVIQRAETERQRRIIDNIQLLDNDEQHSLFWVWQQPKHRARASINNITIKDLYKFGLLAKDDPKQPSDDCIWVIPDFVAAELTKNLSGMTDIPKPSQKPPWDGKYISSW